MARAIKLLNSSAGHMALKKKKKTVKTKRNVDAQPRIGRRRVFELSFPVKPLGLE